MSKSAESKRLHTLIYQEQCKTYHDYLLPLVGQFARAYKNEPKWAMLWLSSLAHNDASALYSVDQQIFELFVNLENEASANFGLKQHNEIFQLKNSFLFLISDHG